ncbi:MAG: amidase [Lautropia sp.]
MIEDMLRSVAACARQIRAGGISSVELTAAALDRIGSSDARLNAFLSVDAESALAAARACDADIGRGEWRGPLHGVPYALKDIIDVAGQRTSCHSRIRMDHIARADAEVVSRLRQAGAILIGKTALHEFATGGPSFDLPWPPARNPWDPNIHPGGSSSGSAVAVAAGMVPLALGTDTAGSVRHPATVCGIVGIKPTYDAISLAGTFPLSYSLDCMGLLTHGVLDSAVTLAPLLTAEAARRIRRTSDPMAPFPGLEDGLGGLRIGVIEAFQPESEIDPEIGAATAEAIRALQHAGARVRPLRLSPLAVYTECGKTILQSEAYSIHAAWLRARHAEYGRRGRRRLAAGLTIPVERYIRAQQVRAHLIREYAAAMQSFDVAVCASSLAFACRIDDEATVDRTYDRQARTPFNVLGTPAISIPIGVGKAGLPMALQIAGRPYDEPTLLRAARGLEQALGLSLTPPCAASR